MGQKRNSSMRLRGLGNASNLKNSKVNTAVVTPEATAATEDITTRIKEGQALPTSSEPQSLSLSNTNYQSIAARYAKISRDTSSISKLIMSNSGILAASLQRSKDAWLTDCSRVMERYWTKPSKKKAMPKNPPKDSMVRFGLCTLKVEPHAFDVILYGVKAQPAPSTTPITPQPAANATIQAGRASEVKHPSPFGYPQFRQSLPPTSSSRGAYDDPSTTKPGYTGLPPHRTASQPPQGPNPYAGLPPHMKNNHQSVASPPTVEEKPDPVIQLLAAKATTDTELKQLMSVVASERATRSELERFQAYVDRLNATLELSKPPFARVSTFSQPSEVTNQRSLPPDQSSNLKPISSAPPSRYPAILSTNSNTPSPVGDAGNGALARPIEIGPKVRKEPSPQPASHDTNQPRWERPQRSSQAEYVAVVLEFTAGSGDRFLFPRSSFLEFSPDGTRVICSFMALWSSTEGASDNDGHGAQHQVITMVLSASSPKILEPLSRVVDNQAEVILHMNNALDSSARARTEYLVLNLPREPDTATDEGRDLSGGVQKGEGSDRYTWDMYTPPGALRPLFRH